MRPSMQADRMIGKSISVEFHILMVRRIHAAEHPLVVITVHVVIRCFSALIRDIHLVLLGCTVAK